MDLITPHPCTEGEAGEDGRPWLRIGTRDVGGGVGLGVTEPLRLGQRLLEWAAFLRHGGEDEVGRSVDYPREPG